MTDRRLVPPALLLILAGLACTSGSGHGTVLGTPTPSASPSPTPAPLTSLSATYGAAELERLVIASLRKVGVRGSVAEHGFRAAWIQGRWQDRQALVHAYVSPRAAASGETRDTVDVDDVTVVIVATDNFGILGRFVCRGVGYDVGALSADGDAGSSTRTATENFLKSYVPVLDC